MSIYFCHQVEAIGEERQSVYTKIRWHPQYTLLALASKNVVTGTDGRISVCHDEGELIEDMTIERSVLVEHLEWHPQKKLLASGWQNGVITISNINETEVHQQSSMHHASISTLQWSTEGGYLISSDKSGLVIVWCLESRGKLLSTPVHQNRLAGEPTHCVLIKPSASTMKPTSYFQTQDCFECFFANDAGTLYYMNANGQCIESEKVEHGLKHVIYSSEKSLLAVISKDLLLITFSVDKRESPTRISEAKLGGQGTISSMIWAPDGVLATCSTEPHIRFWDCIERENFLLSLKDHITCDDDVVVTDICYNTNYGLIAAGTNKGHTIIWTRENKVSDGHWNLVTSLVTPGEGRITAVEWNSNKHLLAVNQGSRAHIFIEHEVAACYSQEVSAVQVSPNDVVVHCHTNDTLLTLNANLVITGVTVNKEHIAVWDGNNMAVYSLMFDKDMVKQTGTFASESPSAALYEHNIYTVEDDKLFARSVQGVIKHKLPFGADHEDDTLASLHVSGQYLVLGMKHGAVRMWDLSRREPKLVCGTSVAKSIPHFNELIQVQINNNGTKISLVLSQKSKPSVLAIMDTDKELIRIVDYSVFHKEITSEDPKSQSALLPPPDISLNIHKEQDMMACQLEGAHILKSFWDTSDPRLLLVEFQRENRLKKTESKRHSKQAPDTVVLTIFITEDMYILLQNTAPLNPEHKCSLGCAAPSVYYMRKNLMSPHLDSSTNESIHSFLPSLVERSPLKDFIGLEDCDPNTVKAILSFSYYSATGNMDEAFKSIRTIKSQKVWESLARMCVKTHRLDVALVCLGNMGNARAAKAVREAQNIPEPDARLAVLAIQLGMLDEAEELYKSSGRYDLLNLFYQASGRWQKAIEIAEINDRMHLKTTYFNLAMYSEALGEIKPAIRSYEQSETHSSEVMRMLMDDPDELEEYVMNSKDKEIKQYWGEYLESLEDFDGAMQYYEECGDIHSLVRVLQFSGNVERAIEVVDESQDKASAYHMARHLSNSDHLPNIRKAIQFFTMAHCYTPAIQLAKDHGLDTELMNLALLSTREDQLDAAKFYEVNSDTQDKAIILYHKAGELSKALELCFQYRQYDALQVIAEDLSEGSSPEIVRKVAEYFVQQEQFDKAVDILLRSNKVFESLELCVSHHVRITEELAKRMTPIKPDNDVETPDQAEHRIQLLEYLADCLATQGQWHLATKKYTQAGNKIKAMKTLLKSGDTDKIVFFANVSRQREIYVMAANYLQSLDWRGNPDIMKNIIGFYTKGRSLESLANFYDMCAQVEIDEYQNYDRAHGAMNEAMKCLNKNSTKTVTSLEEKKEFLQQRMALIKRFADARNIYGDNPDQCVQECHNLLEDPKIDTAVRVGDVYGLLIAHNTQLQNYKQAYDMIEEMRRRIPGVNLEFYLDTETLEAIYKAHGVDVPIARGVVIEKEQDDEEIIEEVD